VRSTETIPFRVIPELGKILEDSDKSASTKTRGILDENEARHDLADDTSELSPKSRSLTIKALSFTDRANILAWKSSANDIDLSTPRLTIEAAHIVPDWKSWE
jgi:hypothetical protein